MWGLHAAFLLMFSINVFHQGVAFDMDAYLEKLEQGEEDVVTIRLDQGQTERDGIVMVRELGTWGPICGVGFGKKEADVVCKELGFRSGQPLCCNPYGIVEWDFQTRRNITCHGHEKKLDSCLYQHFYPSTSSKGISLDGVSDTYCPEHQYAAVVCSGETLLPETDVTLSIAGNSKNTGRLVLTYNGIQGGVCADSWDQKAADRACKDMGFHYGTNYTYVRVPMSKDGKGPVWISNVSCDGASSFRQCQHEPFGSVSTCTHYAAVLCYNDFSPTDAGFPSMRLAGDPEGSLSRGRVEVYIDGHWGTIDHYQHWTAAELHDLCISLGFPSGRLLTDKEKQKLTSSGTGTVWNVKLNCSETGGFGLEHCQVDHEWSPTYYYPDHTNDLAIACAAGVELRFGSSASSGVVFVRPTEAFGSTLQEDVTDSNTWLPVCNQDFDDNDANKAFFFRGVVCRQLGYETGLVICCGEPYGHVNTLLTAKERQGDIILMESYCTGNESSFLECAGKQERRPYAYGCGNYGAYATVTCFDTVTPREYLLSLGYNDVFYYRVYNNMIGQHLQNQTWGAVSVLYNGMSGRICAEGWDDKDARVACRELGFKNGFSYLHYDEYESGRLRKDWLILSSDFDCNGDEQRLGDCPHDAWGHSESCYDDAAGVYCYNEGDGVQYRLYNPDPDSTFGRVEILEPGSDTWGTLCTHGDEVEWVREEAQVACRTFGYRDGYLYPGDHLPPSHGPVYQRVEFCYGDESHLDHCAHDGFVPAYDDICKYHKRDAVVFCTPYDLGSTFSTPDAHQHHNHPVTTAKKPAQTTKRPTTTTTTTTKRPTTTTTTTTKRPTTTTTTTTIRPTTTTTTTTRRPPTTTTTTTKRPTTTTTTTTNDHEETNHDHNHDHEANNYNTDQDSTKDNNPDRDDTRI